MDCISKNSFLVHLGYALLSDRLHYEAGHRDFVRYQFNVSARAHILIKDQILAGLSRLGWVRQEENEIIDSETLEFVLSHPSRFEYLYHALVDDGSRRLLVDFIRLRILGQQHSPFADKRLRLRKENCAINKAIRKYGTFRLGVFPNVLNYYELNDIGLVVKIHANS